MIGTMARRMTSPVLVGRSDVVGQLQAALESALAGEPQHVVIGGEAGIGKTRMLAATAESATALGFRVLTGRCLPIGDAGLPFAPYTEILRSLVARDGAATVNALAGRAAGDLARLVPALGAGEASSRDELWAQLRLHEALLDLLRRLAERSPLLVGLEDLHWADAGTLSATSYLLRASQGMPMTVLATFRSDDITRNHPLRPWLAEVARDARVERLDLSPLDAGETALLSRHILGGDLPAADLAEIWQRSDGNPFFIEELLASREGARTALSASLRDVLLARVDTLSEGARRLIGVAAVGGREVEHDVLVEVAGGEELVLDSDLRALVDAGHLVPSRAFDDDDAYSFRHALLQEAVYETLLPTERRRLHGRWAEILGTHGAAQAGADQLVNLAHHWREARDARALEASVRAGDAAMAGYAYAIATDEYEEALLAWQPDRDTVAGVDHVDLLERAGRAAYLATRYRRAVACCQQALAELDDDDAGRRSTMQILLGRVLWVSGDHAASIVAYEEGVRIAPREQPLVRARAVAGLGQVYMLGARLREARPLCEEAIAAARASGARDIEGHGLNTLGVVLSGLGEIRAANEAIAQSLAIALELGIPDDIGRAYVNRAEIEAWSGYPDQALATSIEGMQVAADWGVSSIYGAFIGFGGVSFGFEAGRWDQAAAMAAEASRVTGDPEGVFVYSASYLLELLACRGDPGFEALWDRVRRRTAGAPASDNAVAIIQGGLWWLSFSGRFREAMALLDEGLALMETTETGLRASELARLGAWSVAELGREARRSGDADGWREASERMAGLADLTGLASRAFADPGERLERIIELDRAQVEAERTRMEGRSDQSAWAALALGWSEVGRPFRAALARWREAEAAEASGDRDPASQALREAHGIASRLGAGPLVGQLEALARRLRVRLAASVRGLAGTPGPAYGLTPREREVLDALAAGRTNRQIADALFISESTAGVHVSNILGKLGVATRTEAARLAIDQGLLDRGNGSRDT